ncbi:MAG TPA: heme biosynthesis HemY N-terminal domain-containing protein [Casimicrobiaceae bacterium]|nr:heme biosynthesis HemY N-terminal domain-containing protein [Casimicrobiaceae bacterium]
MRALLAFLLLAAAAVALAMLFRLSSGYVLFVAPPYRIELSQNAFIILTVLAFVALYALIRAAVRLSQLPADVREARKRRQVERFRAKQDAAVVALIEGRHGKARQYAQEALAIPNSSAVPALVGARAALETRDYAAASTMLERPDAQATKLAVPRLMLEAELALERGQPAEALARLAELKSEAGLHTAAQRLELRALTAAGRPGEIPALVDQLVKRKVYDPQQGELLRAGAHAEALKGFTHDAAGLRAYWARVADGDRLQPRVAKAAARSFVALNGDREAAEILVKSLERQWDSSLLLLYAQCRAPDATRQLEIAERWLTTHNQDATLLFVLGRLCERQQLWGKAQTYLEASLALDNHWRTHVALGEMLAKLGRHDEADAHLAAALRLALAALESAES